MSELRRRVEILERTLPPVAVDAGSAEAARPRALRRRCATKPQRGERQRRTDVKLAFYIATQAAACLMFGTVSAHADPLTIGSYVLIALMPGTAYSAAGATAAWLIGSGVIGLGATGKSANIATFRKPCP